MSAAPARAVAARVLERVEEDDAWADLVLDAELARGHEARGRRAHGAAMRVPAASRAPRR